MVNALIFCLFVGFLIEIFEEPVFDGYDAMQDWLRDHHLRYVANAISAFFVLLFFAAFLFLFADVFL